MLCVRPDGFSHQQNDSVMKENYMYSTHDMKTRKSVSHGLEAAHIRKAKVLPNQTIVSDN